MTSYKPLEATVRNSLNVSDYQLMTVEAQPGNELVVLPPSNLGGIHQQLIAQPDNPVIVANIGTADKGLEYAVLLNKDGSQFGTPVDYHDDPGPVIFVGTHDQGFTRGNIDDSAPNEKGYFVPVTLPGGTRIDVRYSDLFGSDPDFGQLKDFQGFVVHNSNGPYKFWLPLNPGNLQKLYSQDQKALDFLARNLKTGIFDFYLNTEPLTMPNIDEVVKTAIVKINVYHPKNQKAHIFEIPFTGESYTVEQILSTISPMASGPAKDVVDAFNAHMDLGGNFALGTESSKPGSKNKPYKLKKDRTYGLRMGPPVEQPEPEETATKKEDQPKKKRRQQPVQQPTSRKAYGQRARGG